VLDKTWNLKQKQKQLKENRNKKQLKENSNKKKS
jgi:hypothetical protein